MRISGLAVCTALTLLASAGYAQTVTPPSITSDPSSTCDGNSEMHNVCITLPPDTTVDTVDVFLVFDDTGSFAGTAPELVSVFSQVVTDLQLALPGVDLAFGVGRFEDYGGPGTGFSGENETGRPFILNQAILATDEASFAADLAAALANTAPGFGGDGPESAIAEGLWQIATGVGFDGNGDGDTVDSGPAGALATQTAPGASGDVPAFSSYVGTGTGGLGGVGWRPGSLRLVLLATDICPVSTFTSPEIPADIVGTGSTEPVSVFACTSTTPGTDRFGFVSDSKTSAGNTIAGAVAPSEAATVQETIDALNALGIRVIGLAPGGAPTSSTTPGFSPSIFLSGLARLTGAVDDFGDPLVLDIFGGAAAVGDAIVDAIESATTAPIDITITADPMLPGLTVSCAPLTHFDVEPGDMVCFDCTFDGDGSFEGGDFDLNFRDVASNSVIGTIPVSLVCGELACVVLNFETEDDFATPLANGQGILSPEEFGRLVSITGFGPHTYGAAIFDSAPGGPNAGGPDLDLLVDMGNILILQESGLQTVPDFYDDPDDAQLGGTLIFDFIDPVELRSVDLIDICPGPPVQDATLTLIDEGFLTRTYFVPGGWTNDGVADSPPGFGTLDLATLGDQPGFMTTAIASQDLGFDPTRVVQLHVSLSSSGALDNLEFCMPIETPPPLGRVLFPMPAGRRMR